MRDYRELVVKYLLEGYQSGITPNPDVMCNREMKFGVLWDWAQEHGFEAIATGHYARKVDEHILRGADPNKDQTYFLFSLDQAKPERAEIGVGPVLAEDHADAGLGEHVEIDDVLAPALGGSVLSLTWRGEDVLRPAPLGWQVFRGASRAAAVSPPMTTTMTR